jgi:hypothetical protein
MKCRLNSEFTIIFNLIARIEKKKENWHDHILRMITDGRPKVLLNYKPRGY